MISKKFLKNETNYVFFLKKNSSFYNLSMLYNLNKLIRKLYDITKSASVVVKFNTGINYAYIYINIYLLVFHCVVMYRGQHL